MEIFPSEYSRNSSRNDQLHDKNCSTSFNNFNIRANGQEWKKGQDSTQKWIKTATSEDFRRGITGRPRTIVTSPVHKPHNIHKKQFLRDDYLPSELNGSTDDSLKMRTKYRTTIIIVLVSSCFVALAVALAVVFVFAKPQNEKTNSPHMFVITEGEMSVLQTFTDDLHNKTSEAYTKFTADFSSVMENGLRKEFPWRRKCYVTNLRNGSIVVSFLLFLETENKDITNNSLKTVVKSAMRNDTGNIFFGNLPVRVSSLSFSKVDVLKEPSNSPTLAKITTRTLTTTKTSIPHKTSTPPILTQTTVTTKTPATLEITSATTANIPFATDLISPTDDNKTLTKETNSEQPTEATKANTTRIPSTSITSNSTASTVTTNVDPSTSTTENTKNELNGTTKFNITNNSSNTLKPIPSSALTTTTVSTGTTSYSITSAVTLNMDSTATNTEITETPGNALNMSAASPTKFNTTVPSPTLTSIDSTTLMATQTKPIQSLDTNEIDTSTASISMKTSSTTTITYPSMTYSKSKHPSERISSTSSPILSSITEQNQLTTNIATIIGKQTTALNDTRFVSTTSSSKTSSSISTTKEQLPTSTKTTIYPLKQSHPILTQTTLVSKTHSSVPTTIKVPLPDEQKTPELRGTKPSSQITTSVTKFVKPLTEEQKTQTSTPMIKKSV